MTAESTRIWRCPSCNRLLVEKGVDYARARHAELLRAPGAARSSSCARRPGPRTSPRSSAAAVAAGASEGVPAGVVRGQLDLQIDAVVLQ